MRSGLVVAAIVGVAIAVQAGILGRASRDTHPLAVSTALQVAGLMAGVAWLVVRGSWSQVRPVSMEWWWLPVGALGWAIVAALGFAVERVGVSVALALVVTAQLVAGIVVDRLSGDLTISLRHPLGVGLLIAGLWLLTRS